jgi:hypothetical protein
MADDAVARTLGAAFDLINVDIIVTDLVARSSWILILDHISGLSRQQLCGEFHATRPSSFVFEFPNPNPSRDPNLGKYPGSSICRYAHISFLAYFGRSAAGDT